MKDVLDELSGPVDGTAAASVRDLARRGLLAERARTAPVAERALLTGGAYEIVWRVVFQRLTRQVEMRRGHYVCASSVLRLEPDCLDRFQDDVEAVLAHLLQHARMPIQSLEAWIATRLTPATVDAHRRRRGERGALQRPRLPEWLKEALGRDPWLSVLAVEVLVWVGVPVTAGLGIWPLDAWSERRATVTDSHRGADTEVARDVDVVLAAMRRNAAWYAKFVERPLGRKQAPVLPAPRRGVESEPSYLALTERHEVDEARLTALAAEAVVAIEARVRAGVDPRTAVTEVVRTVFGGGTGAEAMDRTPATGPEADERGRALVAEPATIERIVSAMLDILPGADQRP
ncbi:hypothetical protein [Asanoa siamensis]|uniref:hypothetical protein n=1 Tax=Asanoa siamensis TaxID=926357 RepID=UPI001941E87E|nr:hypothetical protein [Asanoa siamensis]